MTCDRGRILTSISTSPTKATPLTSFDLIRRREGTMIARLHLLLQSLCLAWYWSHATGQSQNSIVQFHGSGSSVQERCFWHIMETMRSQIKVPTWTTYRSISSGPGQEEFIGNLTHSFSDFGSSDFPLSKEQYAALIDAGQEIVHLPVLMGAIGIFHSVPLINDDQMSKATHLNLTSCLVARIFKGDIKDWTHQDIADINPTLRLPAQLDFYGKPKADQSYPIKVAHRGSGSASTFTFTSYLHKTCPEHWGADLVGAEITWPMAGSDNLFTVEGTSGMITTIHREPGTIGYSDAGAGIDEGLVEVALKMDQTTMKEAFFLTSQNALSKDGVAAALEGATFPSSGADDWSSVDVINQVEGYIYAWPLVLITYVLVRKDLTAVIPDPVAQSLLVEFLKSLYDPLYTEKCEKDFLFLPVKGKLQEIALQSIETLEVSPDAPQWTRETSVISGAGQGDFVISTRRQQSSLIQQDILTSKIRTAEITLEEIVIKIDSMESTTLGMKGDFEKVVSAQSDADASILAEKGKRTDASFIMAIVSLVLWSITAVAFCNQQSKLRQLELRPRIIQQEQSAKKKRVQDAPV